MMKNPFNHGRKISGKYIFPALTLLILFMLWFLILAIIAPGRKIEQINSEYGYQKPEKGGLPDSIFYDSTFIMLGREKAFYKARLAMAAYDSATLSINLHDSVVTIEIKGVPVYREKILSSRISKIFYRANEYAVTTMLSNPLSVSSDISTIRKEPVVHKVAPKDTSEYKPDALPDTSKIEYANFILLTEEGIKLYFFQDTKGNIQAGLRKFLFDFADRVKNSVYLLRCMVTFRKPEYQPFIKITIPRKSAVIIYRALPYHGKVAVGR